MNQILRDDYEYEGGGYAIWDFRSDYQNGDSDAQALTDVEYQGDGNFKASYFDMGASRSVILSVVVKDDKVLFDEIIIKGCVSLIKKDKIWDYSVEVKVVD